MADFVVSLGHDGRILSQGTLSEALKSNEALLNETNTEKEGFAESSETADDVLPETIEGKGGKLIATEEVAEGHVGSRARGWYHPCQRVAPTDLETPVKMYLFGMSGISPVLFWATVVFSWALGEAVLALVRVSFSFTFVLFYG